MPDEDDTQDEGGLEPAENDPDVAVADVEEAPEPETYTRDQLAELLPHFDRFATHEGPEAFKQYGTAYENARRLISTGGHQAQQEESAYLGAGIDPSEVAIPVEEEAEAPGLWGTPWQEPTTWEEVQAYANSEDPEARRLAAMAVMKEPSAPDDIKRAYFSHWAAIDPAGATLYNQQVLTHQQEEMRDKLRQEILSEVQPLLESHEANKNTLLGNRAHAEIAGWEDHKTQAVELMNAHASWNPGYAQAFQAAPMEHQLEELSRWTIIAAAKAEPQRKAARAQATDETDAAKQRARTQTSRTSGAPETDVDARRRAEREVLKRIGGTIR